MKELSGQFAVRSKRVVTPGGILEGAVLVEGEKIAGVVGTGDIPSGWPVDDCGDLVVMPGLVDTHVHINEPGRTEWEGFETATKAAAAGGITTLVDMPLNSSPVTTTAEAFHEKLQAADGKLWVDCGFYGGLIPGNSEHLRPMIEAGVLGIKAFLVHSGIDEFPNVSEDDLRVGMQIILKGGVPLLVHAELSGSNTQPPASNARSYVNYLSSRPRQWEHDAIELMIRLCREYRCRTHIVHLSSADALPMIRKAREEGLPLTVETCPHYLYFSSEEIADGDTRFKCAPPIREGENRERLWQALGEGLIDFIVSDHSPSTPSLKLLNEGNFQQAWGGIVSLQFGLPVVWTELKKRGFAITDVARLMCGRPAQFIGLEGKKGAIAQGYDADIAVWDPDETFLVEPSIIEHRHKIAPYEGKTLAGKVKKTYLRGKKIFENGKLLGNPEGQKLLKLSNNPLIP